MYLTPVRSACNCPSLAKENYTILKLTTPELQNWNLRLLELEVRLLTFQRAVPVFKSTELQVPWGLWRV